MSFFKKLLGVAATGIGAYFGGPVGAGIGNFLGGVISGGGGGGPVATPSVGSYNPFGGPGGAPSPPIGVMPGTNTTFPSIFGTVGNFIKEHPYLTGAGALGGLAAIGGGGGGGMPARGGGINPRTGLPRGYRVAFDKHGNQIMVRRRRAHGLTGRDLRGFRRTVGLLKSVGMVPRRLGHARFKRRAHA